MEVKISARSKFVYFNKSRHLYSFFVCSPLTLKMLSYARTMFTSKIIFILSGKKNVDQYDKNNDGVGDECETCRNEACFTDTLPSCSGLYSNINRFKETAT